MKKQKLVLAIDLITKYSNYTVKNTDYKTVWFDVAANFPEDIEHNETALSIARQAHAAYLKLTPDEKSIIKRLLYFEQPFGKPYKLNCNMNYLC